MKSDNKEPGAYTTSAQITGACILSTQTITIIVPVYNVAEYLPRCVESILKQTHKNLEIILIDDGSTDGSRELCDEYADADSRVVAIHQENAGVSTARNAGLDIAKGEWIGFVDADDWIEQDMYEKLLHAALENNTQLACCNYAKRYSDGSSKGRKYSDTPETLNRDMMLTQVLHPGYRYFNFYCYLYHHTLFIAVTFGTPISAAPISDTPIRFDPAIHYCEDRLMLVQAVIYADGTAYIPDVLYNYLQRHGSAIYTINKKRMTYVAALKQIVALAQPISPEVAKQARQLFLMRTEKLLSYLCQVKDYEKAKWLRNEIRVYISEKNLKKGLALNRKTRNLAALYLPKSIVGALSRRKRQHLKDLLDFEED